MANNEIRLAAKKAGIPFWAIAQTLEISEATFTRRMRNPLPPEEAARILKIIENLRFAARAEQQSELILK